MRTRHEILRDMESAKARLKSLESELSGLDKSCRHVFAPPVADHIYHAAYTIPGDPPGTCGVDWRPATHVPARTEKRWKRTCTLCGLEQFTKSAEATTVETPKF